MRFSIAGEQANPIDDELALLWHEKRLHAIDRDGARVDTLERTTVHADTRASLARVGGDVVLKIDMYDRSPGLLRITPRTLSAPHWEAPFPADNARFSQGWPVRVGRFIALYLHGPPGKRGVFIVDAESGAHVTTLACDDESVGGLVAVADDAVATNTVRYKQRHTDVWTGIGGPSPRRITIEHEGHGELSYHAMCVPKPGVIACVFHDVVCLYRVS